MLLIDTSAWIEFFIKSGKGEKLKAHLKTEGCYTSIVSVAEISNWASKEKFNAEELIGYVVELAPIIGLNLKNAFLAGELNFQRKQIERNWGMIDSIILSTAQIHNLKILTKDSRFNDLPNVEPL